MADINKANTQKKVICAPELVAQIMEAVFPICKLNKDGVWKIVGTGFFISPFGIFATAKHVLMDAFDKQGKQTAARLVAMIIYADNNGKIFNIPKFYPHKTADVAVGIINLPKDGNGNVVYSKNLVLIRNPAPIGEIVITFAYPNSEVKLQENQQAFYFAPWFYQGRMEEYYKKGRDGSMLPAPCYRTSIQSAGGASGGPVQNTEGEVFGINSTGFDGTNISFASRVEDLLPIKVDVSLDGKRHQVMSIKELAYIGKVALPELKGKDKS